MSAMGSAKCGGSYARLWHGQVPAAVLLWLDIVAVGSMINMVSTVAAILLLSQGSGLPVAAAVHFCPIPYNLFLLAAFWRSPQRTMATAAIALVWLCLMTLV